MKLSQIRKCDSCDGVLAPQGMFYVVRASLAIVQASAFNQTMGLVQMFGGGRGSLAIAEAMSPQPDVVLVAGDKQPELMDEYLICQECYLLKGINFAQLSESAAAQQARATDVTSCESPA